MKFYLKVKLQDFIMDTLHIFYSVKEALWPNFNYELSNVDLSV